jgi:hypothetical protein
MVLGVFFLRYTNRVRFEIDESDLICVTYAPDMFPGERVYCRLLQNDLNIYIVQQHLILLHMVTEGVDHDRSIINLQTSLYGRMITYHVTVFFVEF